MTFLGTATIAMGVAIAGVWTRDIVANPGIDRSRGLARAREGGPEGSWLLPHWIAEYATALGLIVGGAGLLADTSWSEAVSLAALGALTYTSTNSLGWALASSERRPYAVPMVVGIVVGVTGIAALLIG